MSCRWGCATPAAEPTEAEADLPQTLAVYVELIRARRREDFRWFARSQGVPADRIDALWEGLSARTRADVTLVAEPPRPPDEDEWRGGMP